MKKSTKWILIITGAVLVLLTAVILTVILTKDSYLEKLPYDDVSATAYNQTKIVSEDGAYYLLVNGKKSKQAYSYLKSVNDFYEDRPAEETVSRYLYNYYLAKKANDTGYWLVSSDGSEARITGDNLSLVEAPLPFLIFQNNANSRMSALSLRAVSSDLSSLGNGELSLLGTFFYIEAKKTDSEQDSFDYLLAQNDQEGKEVYVFSALGKKLFVGGDVSLLAFEKENGDLTSYFVDNRENRVYSFQGELLSQGSASPQLSPDQSFAYQYSSSADSMTQTTLTFFSADHSFTISGQEYDLAKLQMVANCVVVDRMQEHAVDVINPAEKAIASYQSVTSRDGFLIATRSGEGSYIYLSSKGKELLRSPYDDLKRNELSTDHCFVFTSPAYDNTLTERARAYFFAADGAFCEKKLASDETLQLPAGLCLTDCSTPTYLIGSRDTDGTQLYRIYAPFATEPESNQYHQIDFYCHGGVVWALGTSYTRECIDVLDPSTNALTISVAAKNTDLARLSFEHCDTQSLLTDPYDSQSEISTVLLKLTRYEDKQAGVVSTRYFALYRAAYSSSPTYEQAPLQIKELGQNPLMNCPYQFVPEKNALVIHHATGSRVYRYDESHRLTECASVPYFVCGFLQDAKDATKLYLKISSVSDRNGFLSESERIGLAYENGAVLLPPIYESISHAEGTRFIVRLRQAFGVVEYDEGDVDTLIDFEYRSITPLADGAYLAIATDGTGELYEGKKRLERGIANCRLIEMVATNEDGYLIFATAPLLNIDGELYFHEPLQYLAPVCDEVETPPSHSGQLTDRRLKLISYYDASGTLIASDLLLPTVTDQKYFETNHTGAWYFSPNAKDQTTPVTQEMILSSYDHFFHLYPKAAEEASK